LFLPVRCISCRQQMIESCFFRQVFHHLSHAPEWVLFLNSVCLSVPLFFLIVYTYIRPIQCLGHLSLLPHAPVVPYPLLLASRQNLFCFLLQFC
jgi:hypothetical protein